MPTNTLTDARCKAAKPTDKLQKLYDGHGLHLAITPKGAKVWRAAYRLDGKPQTLSFGPYPAVTLAEARQAIQGLKADLRAGIDPASRRKQSSKAALTFRQASEDYWAGCQDLSPKYLLNMRRAFEMHLYPQIGDTPIADVKKDVLMTPLLALDARGKFVYVRRVLMWSGQVFAWATSRGLMEVNPAKQIDPSTAFGRRKVKHFPALTLREIPTFMQRLALEEPSLQSVLACRLLAYTWVRTTELRGMTWDEIDGDRWDISAERMKADEPHTVPLPRQALVILATLKRQSRGSRYVFAAEHRQDRTMSENAVLALLARIGYKGKMTGHGWRTVGSTWANEAGYAPDVIEAQLAHEPDNDTRAAYNRAGYMKQRRDMLQAFADWLDNIGQDATLGAPGSGRTLGVP